jgi:hypothetical protein
VGKGVALRGRLCGCVVVLAGVPGVVALGAAPALARGGCQPKARSVVARSHRAVVYRGPVRGPSHRRLTYACVRATGKSLLLDLRGEGRGSVDPRTVRLRGWYVAYGDDFVGIDSDYELVVVRDLRSGRVVHRRYPRSPGFPGEGSVVLDSILLKRDGAVAWIVSVRPCCVVGRKPPAPEVARIDRRGFAVLNRNQRIHPKSLTLRGSTIRWRTGTRTHHSSLL